MFLDGEELNLSFIRDENVKWYHDLWKVYFPYKVSYASIFDWEYTSWYLLQRMKMHIQSSGAEPVLAQSCSVPALTPGGVSEGSVMSLRPIQSFHKGCWYCIISLYFYWLRFCEMLPCDMTLLSAAPKSNTHLPPAGVRIQTIIPNIWWLLRNSVRFIRRFFTLSFYQVWKEARREVCWWTYYKASLIVCLNTLINPFSSRYSLNTCSILLGIDFEWI